MINGIKHVMLLFNIITKGIIITIIINPLLPHIINSNVWVNHNWLVVHLPLWKMMDFVSWDDYSIPNMWKVIKFHRSKAPSSIIFPKFGIWLTIRFYIYIYILYGYFTIIWQYYRLKNNIHITFSSLDLIQAKSWGCHDFPESFMVDITSYIQ